VARTSLELIDSTGCERGAGIIDVGGGSSTLVDGLLDRGYTDVSVLDISPEGLAAARERLVESSQPPHWIVADLLDWDPPRSYEIWHDRAVLHFLTDDGDRDRYRDTLLRSVSPGGFVVIGVFAEDGPQKCSGLDVRRYAQSELAEFLGDEFKTHQTLREDHQTPSGKIQHFNWIVSERAVGN
jgi:trans-aconitate methyltransferase